MIEVYRDRLKLDVMVVNAFTQILNIQPTNFEAADELAAQYETMKRWPDLISLLRKKASVVEAPAEKVALQLRIANLFIEKFSNQAEAIKAFEAILEIDPENADALAFVKQMYEKRRDWEKLVAVHQREIEKITDDDVRRARRVEVAKLASEKMKKASVSIELWQKVLADDAENIEALGELEKLYEREKMWNELGAVLERQVAVASDATRRAAIYVKLGVLYTEKVQNVAQATTAWQALLAGGAGQPARAGRAQEALSPAERLERSRGFLRRAGEVGRAGARPRAPGGVRGRGGARRPLEQDRRALSRSSAEGGPGAEGVREGAVVRRQEPAGGRGADPALREGQGRQAPRRGAVRRARNTRRIRRSDRRVSSDSPSCSIWARATRSARCASHCTALAEAPTDSWAIETSRRLAAEGRRVGRAGEGLRGGRAARGQGQRRSGAAGAARHAGRGVRIGARRTPSSPSSATSRSSSWSPRTPRRWGRSSASTSPPGASPICSPSTTRSWSWPRARTRSSRSASSWPASTRTRSSSPTRRCSSISRSSSRIPGRRRRWRRSIGSTSSSDAGKSWRRRSKGKSSSPPTWGRSPS